MRSERNIKIRNLVEPGVTNLLQLQHLPLLTTVSIRLQSHNMPPISPASAETCADNSHSEHPYSYFMCTCQQFIIQDAENNVILLPESPPSLQAIKSDDDDMTTQVRKHDLLWSKTVFHVCWSWGWRSIPTQWMLYNNCCLLFKERRMVWEDLRHLVPFTHPGTT